MSKLIFYYSGMNAGKSAHLLQKSHNLESKGALVRRFTHKMDTRWGTGMIVSRIGIEAKAEMFCEDTDFMSIGWNRNTWIFIDEAQFLTRDQVVTLSRLVDHNNLRVICYGLRTDFVGEPFEGSTYLMAWADEIREIESHNVQGDKAGFNIRVDDNGKRVFEGNQMDIGTHYKSISRKDFFL